MAPSSYTRAFAAASSSSGSGFRYTDRKALLAKAYLREYIKAKNSGDISEAMRCLEKATVAAQHVHVWLPDVHRVGGQDLVPLSAIVPSFSHNEEEGPRFILPATVDRRPSEKSTELPQPGWAQKTPVALVLPFDPRNNPGTSEQ